MERESERENVDKTMGDVQLVAVFDSYQSINQSISRSIKVKDEIGFSMLKSIDVIYSMRRIITLDIFHNFS
jgi:hypothetical protein